MRFMPALPNVANVLRVNLHWTVDADTMGQTVHYFRYSGGAPSGADCASLAITTTAIASAAFQALCNTHVGVNATTVTDLTSSSGGQGEGGTPWVGTRSGGQLSPGTAAVVRHSIARRYRGGKPRSYLPTGTSTDVATTGLWATAFQTAMDTGWGTFTGDMSTISAGSTNVGAIVNISYYHGFTVVISPTTGRSRNVPTLRAVPLVDTITAHSTAIAIGSQRRRNRDA
jgi:hypothetical protein